MYIVFTYIVHVFVYANIIGAFACVYADTVCSVSYELILAASRETGADGDSLMETA